MEGIRPDTAKGRPVINFVSLILRCTVSEMLREGKSREPVRTAFQLLDNTYAVGCREKWRVLEITKRNRTLIELFDVR